MKAVIARVDDWTGFYIDGKLISQGHEVSLRDIFKYLKIPILFIQADDQQIMDQGGFPDNLKDVIRMKEFK